MSAAMHMGRMKRKNEVHCRVYPLQALYQPVDRLNQQEMAIL